MSREAMQMALEALEDANDVARMEFSDENYYGEAIAALRQALEVNMSENKSAKTPADGPVAWSCQCGRPYTVTCISSKPARREWVGLREDEIFSILENLQTIYNRPPTEDSRIIFAQAIEAKLKEKNT